MHPVQPGLLELGRRRPAGLVVDDHQLAVLVDVEPVDDAAQHHVADLCLEPQLHTHGADCVGVLDAEVVLEEHLGVGSELPGLVDVEGQSDELGVVLDVFPGQFERFEAGLDRSLPRQVVPEQPF